MCGARYDLSAREREVVAAVVRGRKALVAKLFLDGPDVAASA
jgi:hypothetical protein